jgi:hypothetical protein
MNTGQRLCGAGPIPQIVALPAPEAPKSAEESVSLDERRYA